MNLYAVIILLVVERVICAVIDTNPFFTYAPAMI